MVKDINKTHSAGTVRLAAGQRYMDAAVAWLAADGRKGGRKRRCGCGSRCLPGEAEPWLGGQDQLPYRMMGGYAAVGRPATAG